VAQTHIVITGLDPVIQVRRRASLQANLDCRVKPGNDGL
jgi:hypothetical protein